MRSAQLLSAGTSRLLIVDMQEKLLDVMDEAVDVINQSLKLIKGAQLLSVPVDATEQYPKGLGPTVLPIADLIPERPDKLRFSCTGSLGWFTDAGPGDDQRHQVVLAGIESHVCVLQTAFDLLACGFEVFVVSDAVTSRNESDYDMALARMSDAGVNLVTTEMVLFEWCEVAGTDAFKQISKIVTERD